MKRMAYSPNKDGFSLRLVSTNDRPGNEFARFRLWWGEDGSICALDIRPLGEELQEFRTRLTAKGLGGLWKGVRISDEDIKEARRELLEKLEEGW